MPVPPDNFSKLTVPTINTVLAAIADFYQRRRLGAPEVRRLDLPPRAPRALTPRDATRWQRTVERWLNPRDRVLALLPFYAGLRIGEAVALDLDDIRRSARKGIIIVRSGKGDRYREVPTHAELREHLDLWIDDERPDWKNADTNPALLLNTRGGRLTTRGAHNIITAIANDANLNQEFSSHVLRHMFITDAILSGLPPHIAQIIAGHRDINVTLGYKAVYPEEAINGHRAFIAHRRALRPAEEYRTPTAEEWQEFLGHPVDCTTSIPAFAAPSCDPTQPNANDSSTSATTS